MQYHHHYLPGRGPPPVTTQLVLSTQPPSPPPPPPPLPARAWPQMSTGDLTASASTPAQAVTPERLPREGYIRTTAGMWKVERVKSASWSLFLFDCMLTAATAQAPAEDLAPSASRLARTMTSEELLRAGYIRTKAGVWKKPRLRVYQSGNAMMGEQRHNGCRGLHPAQTRSQAHFHEGRHPRPRGNLFEQRRVTGLRPGVPGWMTREWLKLVVHPPDTNPRSFRADVKPRRLASG